MKKATKVWLITAASLVAIGCILFAGVMTSVGWNFQKLSTVGYETNTYEFNEPFGDISLTTDTADIVFALSDDGKCRVECREEENKKHLVSVIKDALVIKSVNTEPWYDRIGFHFGLPKIKIYLPKAEYNALSIRESTGNIKIPKDFAFANADISLSTGNTDFCASASGKIKIKASTGDIRTKNITAGSLDLTVSTGDVTVSDVNCGGNIDVGVSTGKTYLTNVLCKSVVSHGSTGDIFFKNVIAAEKFSIKRSTGHVKFGNSDAAEIFVKTDTGDVTGNLLTDKVFITQTDTGDVDVPKTVNGGKCEINTDTGDIKIKIA